MENSRLIILVDDDRTSNFLNKKIIKNTYPDYEIIDFLAAEDALEYLASSQIENNRIDVIMLDINMPEIDGWDFLSELKKRNYSNLDKIILLSSSIDESDLLKAKTMPEISGFITKPLKPEILEIYFS